MDLNYRKADFIQMLPKNSSLVPIRKWTASYLGCFNLDSFAVQQLKHDDRNGSLQLILAMTLIQKVCTVGQNFFLGSLDLART